MGDLFLEAPGGGSKGAQKAHTAPVMEKAHFRRQKDSIIFLCVVYIPFFIFDGFLGLFKVIAETHHADVQGLARYVEHAEMTVGIRQTEAEQPVGAFVKGIGPECDLFNAGGLSKRARAHKAPRVSAFL